MELINRFKIIKRSDFPEWVSDEALAVLEWYGRLIGKDQDEVNAFGPQYDQYVNCFKSKEIEYCWLKAKSLKLKNFQNGQVWLAAALWNSFPHVHSRRMSKGAAEDWKRRLLSLLNEAQEHSYELPENMYEWLSHSPAGLKKKLCFNNYLDSYKVVINEIQMPYPHEIIACLIESLECTEYDPVFSGKHVNSGTSNRMFFMKSLTAALYQEVGQPYRKLVAMSVSAAFDCSITEREVVRATKNLEWEGLQLVVGFESEHFEDIDNLLKNSFF